METAELPRSIEEAWEDFARSLKRRGRSKSTLEIYRKSYDSFWRWAGAANLPADPSKIKRQHVNRWTDSQLGAPLVRNGRVVYDVDPETGKKVARPVQPNTVRIRWQNLRPFFTWWAKEMDEPNPFDDADVPRLEETAIPVIPLDNLRAMLKACDGKTFEDRRDTAIIRFLLDTGARVGEMISMAVDSWDRRQDVVTLTGKTGTRVVPISPSTGEAFQRYMRARHQHASASSKAFWLGRKGALRDSSVAQILNKLADAAGVPHVHPHMFRHTWAHELKAAGAAEGDLMALGGWSSAAMVHRYGKSVAVARAHDAARRVALGDRL